MNLPCQLILDQKVQCLVTTPVILSNRNTYLNLFFLSPLSLALITLITGFVLTLRLSQHPIRLPKTAHLITMASKFFSSSKMSKTGKNVKNPLYIRYNLKIRYIKKVKNRFSIDWECSGQFATFGNSNGWLLPVIHTCYLRFRVSVSKYPAVLKSP